MLVIPALVAALIALALGNRVVCIGLVFVAICDYLGELHQRSLVIQRARRRQR